MVGSPVDEAKRKRAFVPGCGRGYDVLLLASFGYDTWGLEVSESAIQRCLEEKEKNGHKYPVRQTAIGAGESIFVKGDFFADNLGTGHGQNGFDLIYDYTVCEESRHPQAILSVDV